MKPIRRLHPDLIVLCLFQLATLCSLQVGASDAPLPSTTADIERQLEKGRKIYNFYCYFCHGYSGDAETLAARFLTPPPRNFIATDPERLNKQRILDAISNGRPATAMKPFRDVLADDDIEAVTLYVHTAFVVGKQPNTQYHTVENGWYGHDRFRDSFPFATGEIPLDAPDDSLTDKQKMGMQVYLESCISCHDRSHVKDPTVNWEPVATSYPRLGFKTGDSLLPPDEKSSASPFAKHDIAPSVSDLSSVEQLGESLFQQNCAFCHAADGTGKNWIGTFLQPHPRDLTDPKVMATMSSEHLTKVIRDGLANTSMPAWKSVLNDEQIDAVVRYIHRAFHPLPGFLD
ncbi:MAG: c-type cytochrome [Candidatus Thiodiazotropha endolucinida]|nr:c-type cytochrome [Candidatus Thiodiazotropha taylori]MCG8095927.1 c-type cytochrome [Candidatus Thiodiazotropha endolucinida]MCW4265660.1 c-type cytochrome [Candidatus Thiodiazotropha endolucinida]